MSDFIDDPMIENDDANDIHLDYNDELQDSSVVKTDDHADHPVVDSNDNGSIIGLGSDTNVVNQTSSQLSFGHSLTVATVENDNPHKVFFCGSKEEDNAWNEKQATHAFEEENWHLEQAKKAAERGDFSAAKDHRSAADSWHNTGKDYANKIKK